MSGKVVEHDERTVAVENAGYRWAYLLMSFGLLVDVAVRGFVAKQSSWDLMALVLAGGLVTTLYQGQKRILGRRFALGAILTMLAAALVAFLITAIR